MLLVPAPPLSWLNTTDGSTATLFDHGMTARNAMARSRLRPWRAPVLWSPFYIHRYCETVHKRHYQRHSPPVLSPRSEESRNALRFAHDRRRHRRARLWQEG